MPDLIRHPVSFRIPASAGMTTVGYLTAVVICRRVDVESLSRRPPSDAVTLKPSGFCNAGVKEVLAKKT